MNVLLEYFTAPLEYCTSDCSIRVPLQDFSLHLTPLFSYFIPVNLCCQTKVFLLQAHKFKLQRGVSGTPGNASSMAMLSTVNDLSIRFLAKCQKASS